MEESAVKRNTPEDRSDSPSHKRAKTLTPSAAVSGGGAGRGEEDNDYSNAAGAGSGTSSSGSANNDKADPSASAAQAAGGAASGSAQPASAGASAAASAASAAAAASGAAGQHHMSGQYINPQYPPMGVGYPGMGGPQQQQQQQMYLQAAAAAAYGYGYPYGGGGYPNPAFGQFGQQPHMMPMMGGGGGGGGGSGASGGGGGAGGGMIGKSSEPDTNLFIFHLPPDADENTLSFLFTPFGRLESVKVARDRTTGASRGFGFVKFFRTSDAAAAMASLNGFAIGAKRLKVSVNPRSSGPQHHDNAGPGGPGGAGGGVGGGYNQPQHMHPQGQQRR